MEKKGGYSVRLMNSRLFFHLAQIKQIWCDKQQHKIKIFFFVIKKRIKKLKKKKEHLKVKIIKTLFLNNKDTFLRLRIKTGCF